MSVEISVSDKIKQLIHNVISTKNFKPTSEIKCYTGSQIGDGYGSDTIAVEVKDQGKSLHLFLKCAKQMKDTNKMEIDKIYGNEIYFYKIIYPTYTKFLKERGVKDGFQNVPQYYHAHCEKFNEIIILENLRSKGYTLFNKFKCMNDAHLTLVLKTFAKFHAISFAVKHQMKEIHDQICESYFAVSVSMKAMGFYKVLTNVVNDFFSKLDPIEDKDILDKCNNLAERMVETIMNVYNYRSEYSILTKGDCWINNMMILYEDEVEENPVDVMLVDWQMIRRASPVHDLINFFYSVVSKEALENSDHYLQVYYTELSKRIDELGSDPNVLYPYTVFKDEWKKLAIHGFGVAILVIKMLLSEIDETANFEEMQNGKEFNNAEEFIPKIKREDEYIKRVKYLARYMIKNKFL